MKEHEMSEGEEILKEFFEDQRIEYEREKEIRLDGDEKQFRKVDFYLPEYKLYVEFLGQWNLPNHKERYKEKKHLYWKNKIPCIYFYPENLGVLSFLFKRRARDVLKKYNMKWSLFKLNYKLWLKENRLLIIIMLILVFYMRDQIDTMILILIVFGWILFLSIKDTFFK
jgi:hypothetical protein